VLIQGQSVEWQHTVGENDVRQFAMISHDHNPLHLDADYASRTRFGRPIVHGALLISYLSAVMAEKLPGPGSIYLVQHAEFCHPVYINDTVTVRIRVQEVRPSGKVTLEQTVTVGDQVVLKGYAMVLLDSRFHPENGGVGVGEAG
jgi:3-hydroxybutyryl-CoA dehydratase